MTHARNRRELTAPRPVPTFSSILGTADRLARPRVRTNGMERRGFGVGVGCCVLGLIAAAGCAKAPPESAQRLAETKRSEIELEHQLSQLEDRLLGAQAAVHMWREIGRRHEQVSAVACENAERHLEGMAKHFEHQDGKQRANHRRLATAKLSLSHTRMGSTFTAY
jgi:hypothetical protein